MSVTATSIQAIQLDLARTLFANVTAFQTLTGAASAAAAKAFIPLEIYPEPVERPFLLIGSARYKRVVTSDGMVLEHRSDAELFALFEMDCGLPATIVSAAGTATATCTAHGFTTGDVVDISGATPAVYNGPHTITVTGANAFTFSVAAGTASPATGTIIATPHSESDAVIRFLNAIGGVMEGAEALAGTNAYFRWNGYAVEHGPSRADVAERKGGKDYMQMIYRLPWGM